MLHTQAPSADARGDESLPTRDRILRAAREIFERNGTRGTTTREIAEAAAVNEATIFRHFGNKMALLEAMREWSVSAAGLDALMEGLSGDLEADLRTVCNALYAGMMRNRAIIRISLAEEATDPDQVPACLSGPARIREQLVGYFQPYIASGALTGSAQQLATMIMGMMFAMAMKSNRMEWGEEARPEAFIPAFVNTILHGVKK